MDYANIFFTAIFTLEFLIKLIGYGKRYFIDRWNIFDMVIVFISIFGIILSIDTYSQVGPQTTIIRSFRIVRIFFFFKSNRALKNTMMTFMLSFPAMFNIGALLMLINLIFSILGMYLFAEIMPNGELNDYTNFSTFGSSFLTLIRTITGEKWPLLMEAVSRSHSPSYQCVSNPTFEDFSQNNCKATYYSNLIHRYTSRLWVGARSQDLLLLLFDYHEHSLHENVHRYHMANLSINYLEG